MATSARSTPGLKFGSFELDLRTGELSRDGRKLRLKGQPVQVLSILASRAGQLVTREELRAELWPEETFVDFDHGLNNSVNRIREALGDSASVPKYIETLPKHGYRFIAEIRALPAAAPRTQLQRVEPGSAAPDEELLSQRAPAARWKNQTHALIVAGISILAVVAVVGAMTAKQVLKRETPPADQLHSLVVLPFENLSGDPAQDFLADGMTDELITDLARFDSLRVVSRTSAMTYRGAHKSLKTIATELHIDAALEGSITRSGNKVRVRAQLIDARTDQHRWAQSYEADITDVVELQSSIALQVAEQVPLNVSARGQRDTARLRPQTSEAYEDYLKGWYFFDKRTPQAATLSVSYFRKSIQQDPKFPLAYAGLAEALETLTAMDVAPYRQTHSEASEALRHALDLDPTLGEAHAALGLLEAQWNWNWAEAERQMKMGLQFSPGSAVVHERCAIYLQAVGRLDEAVRESRRAAELDPLSFFMNRELGRALYLARRYDEAIVELHRSAELDPHASVVNNWLSWIAEKKGDHVRAMELTLLNAPLDGLAENDIRPLRQAYNARDWRRFCEAGMRLMAKSDAASAPYFAAVNEARLGDKDAAFDCLERALEGKTVWVMWVNVDPLLDDLRSDPRFNELLRKMRLPAPPFAG